MKKKSKSFDLGQPTASKEVRHDQDNSFDFIGLYKTASETIASTSLNNNNVEKSSLEGSKSKRTPKPKQKDKEKRKSVDLSQITIDGLNLARSDGTSSPVQQPKITSTPVDLRKSEKNTEKVKPIIKNSTPAKDIPEDNSVETPRSRKKRNKSVSFMLDDQEVSMKKTKSDSFLTGTPSPKLKVNKDKKHIKVKKSLQAEKENTGDNKNIISATEKKNKKSVSVNVESQSNVPMEDIDTQSCEIKQKFKKKKVKKPKKANDDVPVREVTTQGPTDKPKKAHKKKRQQKPNPDTDNEEPAAKSIKKEIKPEVLTENLENLSIGDNPHSLTNLLDEMTVVDKGERKKLKLKAKKKKGAKKSNIDNKQNAGSKPDTQTDAPQDVIEKEKVPWTKRKWNKEGKGETHEDDIDTTIVVENLSMSMIFSYKKVLADHFVKFGLVRGIGMAEVYAADSSKPSFSTTVMFYSDGAAKLALQENGAVLEGSAISVSRMLPPTQTTLCVRSYGALAPHAVSAALSPAGHIRNIRPTVKGKKSMSTVFVEFDGPESVERALKLATGTRIGGKKIYLSKFEIRPKKSKQRKISTNESNDASDADHSDDNSQD